MPQPTEMPPLKRRHFPFILFLIAIFCAHLLYQSFHVVLPSPDAPIRLYSNQLHDDLTLAVVTAIKKAEHSIHLISYGLTDKGVLSALSSRAKEGIKTSIFYDKSASPNVRIPGCQAVGLGSGVGGQGLMHQKVLVIDHALSWIGSANFTTSSLSMHDNLVIAIYSPPLALFLEEAGPNKSAHFAFRLGSHELSLYLLPDLKGEALVHLKKEIKRAKKKVQVALFTLTHPHLVSALIDAKKRGVTVEVVLDRTSAIGASKESAEALKREGIDLRISQGSQLLHHKFVLIDGQTLVMGSANWTKAAFTKNSDLLLFIRHLAPEEITTLASLYQRIYNGSQK